MTQSNARGTKNSTAPTPVQEDSEFFSDATTTIARLKALATQFVEERNWQSYHTPKNLAMSVAIEAAELMECFQWLAPEESYRVTEKVDTREAVADEIADVFCYLLNLCDELKIDLAAELVRKMAKNAIKYPAPVSNHAKGRCDSP
ncbi:MAG: nucleotide pyrophosphohydrolase [Planctomycetia bacterium]|nr:nucleotide pyrophosphohydrolase [Planctomycetia bacterium]